MIILYILLKYIIDVATEGKDYYRVAVALALFVVFVIVTNLFTTLFYEISMPKQKEKLYFAIYKTIYEKAESLEKGKELFLKEKDYYEFFKLLHQTRDKYDINNLVRLTNDEINQMEDYENENFIPYGFTYDYYMTHEDALRLGEKNSAAMMLKAIVLNPEQIGKYKEA